MKDQRSDNIFNNKFSMKRVKELMNLLEGDDIADVSIRDVMTRRC